MPLPGKPQTFGIENSRDMIKKLKWEIEKLLSTSSDDVSGLCYCAHNAAVTAWQLTDWVYADLTGEQRNRLGFAKPLDLQNFARKNCPALHSLRQVATASKHSIVTRFRDEAVATEVGATSLQVPLDHDTSLDSAWGLSIVVAGERKDALTVLNEALSFWTALVYQNGIGAGEDAG